MANQFDKGVPGSQYPIQIEVLKRGNDLLRQQVRELTAALTRKYKGNPDPDTGRLLLIYGVPVDCLDCEYLGQCEGDPQKPDYCPAGEARPRCEVCGTTDHHVDEGGNIIQNPPRQGGSQ